MSTLLRKIVAGLLLINGCLGALMTSLLLSRSSLVTPLTIALSLLLPVVGIVSGICCFSGKRWPAILGLIFYAVQIVRYHSNGVNFDFRSGLEMIIRPGSVPASLMHQPTFEINLAAAILFMLGIVALIRPNQALEPTPDRR
jgi:hypothetical protein